MPNYSLIISVVSPINGAERRNIIVVLPFNVDE